MPALPVAPQVLRIDYHFDLGEDNHAKCHEFYRYTGGPPSVSDLNTLSQTVMTAAAANLCPLMNGSSSFVEIVITDLTSATSAVGSFAATHSGTRAGDTMPADLCALQSNHVGRRFRGGHCRTYWPFGTQSDLHDPQTWSAAAVTAFETGLANHFLAWSSSLPASLSGVSKVNVSYYNGFTVHTGTTGRARNVSTPRSSVIIDAIIGSLVQAGIATVRKRLLNLA